jgi:hypothetical protein
MASYDTLQALAAHPEWIPPRSDLRVFLGEPGGPEATKTTVEPGNSFSPGMRTFGVTWWIRLPQSGTFFAPETAPLAALRWQYAEGFLPLLHCQTEVEGIDVQHSLFQDGTVATCSEAVCGKLSLTNRRSDAVQVQVFFALRSLGPAGGPVPELAVGSDEAGFWLPTRHLPLLCFDRQPSAIGCGIGDPSPLARTGRVPVEQCVHDPAGWCFGLARYNITLAPGETWQVHLDCPQQTYGTLQSELPGTAQPHPERFEERARAHLQAWRTRLRGVTVDVPDSDFQHAFYAGIQHMLTAMEGDQARIAPLSYPLPWLRDSVYIIHCLDLMGLHEIARAATEYCVRNDFFGGFGAEGDAPGEGIWAIVQHYRITRDRAWLERVYPAIRRKCEWLFRMRRAERPLRVTADTAVLPFMHAQRAGGIICLPAQYGLIMGTMDHGVSHSVGWVNQWALCGLLEAAYAARELGITSDATAYEGEASQLRVALETYSACHPEFFALERTVNSLLWPTRAWAHDPERIRAGFDAWWRCHRSADDDYRPEPYWLYFEFAQAHNALLLGWRERAWRVIEYRLRRQDLPGLYGWREGGHGVGTENATAGVTLIGQLRGCHRFESITPHGWSQAEMWLLQRAVLVEEWDDELLLFAGVPQDWLKPGAKLGFSGLPTWYGRATAHLAVDADGSRVRVSVSGLAPEAPIRLCLPGQEIHSRCDETGSVAIESRFSSLAGA